MSLGLMLIVALVCGGTDSAAVYRLALGDGETYGRLDRAAATSGATWQPVCDLGFTEANAQAVCRSLGLPAAGAVARLSTTSFLTTATAQAQSSTFRRVVRCLGNETTLEDCPATGGLEGITTCRSTRSALVQMSCGPRMGYRVARGPNNFEGFLSVRPSGAHPWGYVCDPSSGQLSATEVDIACRSLGFSTTGARVVTTSSSIFASSTASNYMRAPAARGLEAYFEQVRYSTTSSCSYATGQVYVRCGASTTRPVFQLESNGNDRTRGTLKVLDSTVAATWAWVCGNYFNQATAEVACRTLGMPFNASVISYELSSSGGTSARRHIICTGNETELADCRHVSVSASATSPWRCTRTVVVSCGGGWEYRLAGSGTTGRKGRVEVRNPNLASGAWGTVCTEGAATTLNTVACRSMGMQHVASGANRVVRNVGTATFSGSSQQPRLMSHVACDSGLNDLGQCTFRSQESVPSTCDYRDALYLECARSPFWEYRLVGGTTPFDGRIEVRTPATNEGRWSIVCDDNFGASDAAVACASLGLGGVSSYGTVPAGLRGNTSQPFMFDNLACTGAEEALDECTHVPAHSHNCAISEAVRLTCSAGASRWSYRLAPNGVDLNSNYLRLEAANRTNPTERDWGFVCPTNNSFGATEAAMACRLAFPGEVILAAYVGTARTDDGAGRFPILGGDMQCNGTEAGFHECPIRNPSATYPWQDACTEAAAVYCKRALEYRLAGSRFLLDTTGARAAIEGRFEYRNVSDATSDSSVYRPICSDATSLTAWIACRSLGFGEATSAIVTADRNASSDAQNLLTTGFACSNGAATGVHGCSPYACTTERYTAATLRCYGRFPGISSSGGVGAIIRAGTHEYRLSAGPANEQGILLLRNGTDDAPLRPVCADRFGLSDAVVACRSLGLDTRDITYNTLPSRVATPLNAALLTRVSCRGTEALLHECDSVSTSLAPCTSARDVVYLSCGYTPSGVTPAPPEVVVTPAPGPVPATTPAPTMTAAPPATPSPPGVTVPAAAQWQFRLVGGGSDSGRLEARPTATSAYGTVCDDHFNHFAAIVACRSLGLGTHGVWFRTVLTSERGSSTQPVVMDDLACRGTESHLAECYFLGSSQDNCAYTEAIRLQCGPIASAGDEDPQVNASLQHPLIVDGTVQRRYRLVSERGIVNNVTGRLEVMDNHGSGWNAMCLPPPASYASFARAACVAMGYPNSDDTIGTVEPARPPLVTSPSHVPDPFFATACSSTARYPHACSTTAGAACRPGATPAVVRCGTRNVAQPLPPVPWNRTLFWDIRMVGGSSPTEGFVQVRPASGSSSWRAPCAAGFDYVDARVACRQAGVPDADLRSIAITSVSLTSVATASTVPILASPHAFACSGDEARLDQCRRYTRTDCATTRLYLTCNRLGGHYRLATGSSTNSTSTSGLLEVRLPTASASGANGGYGFMCYDAAVDAGSTTHRLSCNALGLPYNGDAAVAVPRTTSQPSALYFPRCDREEFAAPLECTSTYSSTCSAPRTAFFITCANPPPAWEYSFANGNAVGGRLEVTPPGTSAVTGTLCHSGFTAANARVVCSTLGFELSSTNVTFALASSTAAGAGPANAPSYLRDLRCSGGESAPESCDYTAHGGCDAADAVAVTCQPQRLANSTWEYQIAGGLVEGRLEVRPSGSSGWGTVCDDAFDLRDAEVACRALGFTEVNIVPSFQSVSDAGVAAFAVITAATPIYMDDLGCAGTEAALDECPYTPRAAENCAHTEDIVIACRGATLATTELQFQLAPYPTSTVPRGRGRLQARQASNDGASGETWGTICRRGFSAVDAVAACATLGFPTTSPIIFSAPGSGTILMSNIECPSGATDLGACPFIAGAQTTCTHAEDVGLDCVTAKTEARLFDPATPAPVPQSPPVQPGGGGPDPRRQQAPSGQRQELTSGVLELTVPAAVFGGSTTPNSEAVPLCFSTSHSQRVADALCRSIFGSRRSVGAIALAGPATGRAASNVTHAIAAVYCSDSTTATLNNGECSYVLQAGNPACDAANVVHLSCYEQPLQVPTGYTVRLEHGPNALSGLVRIRPTFPGGGSGSLPFGTLCPATGFSFRSAGLICQAVGIDAREAAFTTSSQLALAASTDTLRGPTYVTSTICRRDTPDFSACTKDFLEGDCTHESDVFVDCTIATSEYRLVNDLASATAASAATLDARPSAGRLEYRESNGSAWKTICSTAFTAADARVACASLGFSGDAVASILPTSLFPSAPLDTPILGTRPNCTGTESQLAICQQVATPASCLHAHDVGLSCGASSVDSGCAGPDACDDWTIIGRNVRPLCPVLETRRRGSKPVTRTECRRSALDALRELSDFAKRGAIPAYTVSPGWDECLVYACRFTADDLVFHRSLVEGASNRLFAPKSLSIESGGFCTRRVACSGRGVATLRSTTRIEVCNIGEADCVIAATTTTTAAPPTATGSLASNTTTTTATTTVAPITTTTSIANASTNGTNLTVAPIVTSTAPTTGSAVQGTRTVTESTCTCACDTGYFGDECDAQAAMTTVAPFLNLEYMSPRGDPTLAQRETFSIDATRILGSSTVTVGAASLLPIGLRRRLRLTVSHDTSNLQAETGAVLQLLRPNERAQLAAALARAVPGATVTDLTTPSFVLRDEFSKTVTVGARLALTGHVMGLPNIGAIPVPVSTAAVAGSATAAEQASTNTTAMPRSWTVLSVELQVRGWSPRAPTSRLRLTIGNTSTRAIDYECEPTVENPELTCGLISRCSVDVDRRPVDSTMILTLIDFRRTCIDGDVFSRRQAINGSTTPIDNGTATSVTMRVTTMRPWPTSYLHTGQQIGVESRTSQEGRLLIGFLAMCGALVVGALFSGASQLGAKSTYNKGMKVIWMAIHLGFVVCLATMVVFALIRFAEGTNDFTTPAAAFIDEYRSDTCDASNSSGVPHRVSRVAADTQCHRMSAFGSTERPFFMKAECATGGGDSYTGAIRIAFGSSLEACNSASLQEVKAAACLDEARFMPDKGLDELQYFKAVCAIDVDADARQRLIEASLDPVADPSVATIPTDLSTTDRMDRPGLLDRIYFHMGAWRSFASRFTTDAPGFESSSALATFSTGDIGAGRVGVPVDVVDFRGALPQSLERVAATSGAVEQGNASADDTTPMASVAPVFNGAGDESQTSSVDQYGAGAMRFMGVEGTLFDIGTLDFARGFTVTMWIRASSATRGFAFLVADAWIDLNGATPIAERLLTAIDNPQRSFFPRTWTTYSAVFVDGSTNEVRFMFQNAQDSAGGESMSLVWSGDVTERLFDDAWHFVAFAGTVERGSRTVQIFVDGKTSYTQQAYKQCVTGTIPSVRRLPPQVPVLDSAREVVTQGGVAYVGHMNGGLFSFMVHDRYLEHQVIVSLGADPMEEESAISVTLSRIAAGILLGYFGISALVTMVQVGKEFVELSEQEAEQQRLNEALENAGRGGSKAGAGASKAAGGGAGAGAGGGAGGGGAASSGAVGRRGAAAILTIFPMFVTVAQNMSLFFQGWDWPLEFQVPFEWIYFPFTLDFIVIPDLPIWVTYAVQFFVALIALGVVYWLSRGDHVTYQQQVIAIMEEDTADIAAAALPRPDMSNPMTKTSYLDYRLDGHITVGNFSRQQLQTSLATAVASDSNDPFVTNPKATLMITRHREGEREKAEDADLTQAMCCGAPITETPRCFVALAKSGLTSSQILRLCGFTHIDATGLLDFYADVKPDWWADDRKGPLTPENVQRLVTEVARHYVIAHELAPALTLIHQRVLQAWNLQVTQEARLRRDRDEGPFPPSDEEDTRPADTGFFGRVFRRTTKEQKEAARRNAAEADQRTWQRQQQREAEWEEQQQQRRLGKGGEAARTSMSNLERDPIGSRPEDTLTYFTKAYGSIALEQCSRGVLNAAVKAGIPVVEYASRSGDSRNWIDRDLVRFVLDRDAANAKAKHDKAKSKLRTRAEQARLKEPLNLSNVLSFSLYPIWNKTVKHKHPDRKKYADQAHELLQTTFEANQALVRANIDLVFKSEIITGFGLIDGGHAYFMKHNDLAQGLRGLPPDTATTAAQREPDAVVVGTAAAVAPPPARFTQMKVTAEKLIDRCPVHLMRLIPAIEEVHGQVRRDGRREDPPVHYYRCVHGDNPIFSLLCCDEDHPYAPCNNLDYFVCPVDSCNYTICDACSRWGAVGELLSIIAGKKYALQRDGATTVIGLLMIILVQAMYQPALRSAITTLFCHVSLQCQFETCYIPANASFLYLAASSAIIIFLLGFGLVFFLCVNVYQRKMAILASSALDGDVVARPFVCGEPTEYKTGDPRPTDVFRVDALVDPHHTKYRRLLAFDRSMFKGLYEQYEFRWMVLQPIFFLFKGGLVLVVLYAGEPNSLPLITAAAAVEALQLLLLMVTSPFTDPWLDILSKGGSLHQVGQLGLMCIYRADTFQDPRRNGSVYAMIALASLYILLVIVVVVVVVIIPIVRAWLYQREQRKEEERAGAETVKDRGEEMKRLRQRGKGRAAAAASSPNTDGDASGSFAASRSASPMPSGQQQQQQKPVVQSTTVV